MSAASVPKPTVPAGAPAAGAELPMAHEPAVPFVEIEALRAKEFVPAAKEALTALIAEQGQQKLIRPVFNWAGRNSLFPLHWGLPAAPSSSPPRSGPASTPSGSASSPAPPPASATCSS